MSSALDITDSGCGHSYLLHACNCIDTNFIIFLSNKLTTKPFLCFKIIITLGDPFTDLDDNSAADSDEVELTQLIEQVCEDLSDFDMYLSFDQDIVCREFDDENWNNEFFLELDRTYSRKF